MTVTFIRKVIIGTGVALITLAVGLRAESRWLPESLSQAARRVIHERMKTHASEMSSLVWDVILLDYDAAEPAASAIAKGAHALDRNAPELEHHIYFFSLQDQLQTRAMALADAARARDGNALSTAFKEVSETCVHCHMVYLDPPEVRRARRIPSLMPEPRTGGAHE